MPANEPIFATVETWVSTYPTWESLVSLKANLAQYGLSPLEWRMHPEPYSEMMIHIASKPVANPYADYKSILGAPLVIDSTIETSRARCMCNVQTITMKGLE